MIKNISRYLHSNALFFRDSPMAHKRLDNLKGIEIGAAAHNPFNLPGSTAVGLKTLDKSDHDFFADEQVKLCGQYVQIEIDAEADDLPLEDESQDYVITSHVVEHLPNLIKAFVEWDRVLRLGGYIFMIFPKRNALAADINRDITPLDTFIRAYEENWDVNSVPQEYMAGVPGGRRGHYWVFTLQNMLELLNYCRVILGIEWGVQEFLETDDKVGNGHCVVLRKLSKPEHLAEHLVKYAPVEDIALATP